ncbi:MAG TPA: SDR family oxidoreductase [Anaerolineales bacterium]|nr:SDR family oxidoreductase [Anaerolineales bacterium]
MASVVLVTGAAGGIGSAVVRTFAEQGWQVLATDRRGDAAPPGAGRFYTADVSQEKDVLGLFEGVRRDVDRLDALVNNAAIQISKPLVDTEVAEWDAVMTSNLRSAYLMARHGHALLRAAHGSIVNVSSVHAVATSVDISAYAASKGGLVALTRAMAIEFAPDGIRVNAVLPGAVDTPMLREGLKRSVRRGTTIEDRLKELGRRTALGRIGRPEEIAQAILFLADPNRSSFMTGQGLIIDGGATMRLSTE